MSKAKKIYIKILIVTIILLFIIWIGLPKNEIEPKTELQMNYQLYINFVNSVKSTFKNTEYKSIFIYNDGQITAVHPDHNCAVANITDYDELVKAYHAIYTYRTYNVEIYFDSARRAAMIIPYNIRGISSEKSRIYKMIYKEEGFESKIIGQRYTTEYYNVIPGEKEWYYWSESEYDG